MRKETDGFAGLLGSGRGSRGTLTLAGAGSSVLCRLLGRSELGRLLGCATGSRRGGGTTVGRGRHRLGDFDVDLTACDLGLVELRDGSGGVRLGGEGHKAVAEGG